MKMPFPGMDPYLEHPVLWESFHALLIGSLARQLTPLLRPRYIAAVQSRVIVERPEQQRIPDVQIQRRRVNGGTATLAAPAVATPYVVEVEQLEVRQNYINILDRYHDLRIVSVIEALSPSNKTGGPGRDAYVAKQEEVVASECHLVEIDLLRKGRHVISVPESHTFPLKPYDCLICVNRWPKRLRFELYAYGLRERLLPFGVPLAEPDPAVPLDVQAAIEQAYDDGSFMLRVMYHQPCVPPLETADQSWANECWAAYKAMWPDLFPPENQTARTEKLDLERPGGHQQ